VTLQKYEYYYLYCTGWPDWVAEAETSWTDGSEAHRNLFLRHWGRQQQSLSATDINSSGLTGLLSREPRQKNQHYDRSHHHDNMNCSPHSSNHNSTACLLQTSNKTWLMVY